MWTHGGVDPPVPGSGWELVLMYCKVGFCSTFESNVVTIQCNVKCARLSEGKWVGILSPPGEGGKVTHAPTLMLGMDAPWQRSSSSSSWSILWSSQSCSNLEKKASHKLSSKCCHHLPRRSWSIPFMELSMN